MRMEGGQNINTDRLLEKEADSKGDAALQTSNVETNTTLLEQDNSSFDASAPIQRVPRVAEPNGRGTRLVKNVNGRLSSEEDLEQGAIGPKGELSVGDRIIINDEDIVISGKGPSQENHENRPHDTNDGPPHEWFRVLSLNGKDISNKNLFIRGGTFSYYEGTLTPEEEVAKDQLSVYWIARVVEGLLQGLQYRIGGSFAARMEHDSKRTPQDIDLEFWEYAEAQKAAEKLKSFNRDEDKSKPYPQLMYFSASMEEKDVSITMIAMGKKNITQHRPVPLLSVELNNENHRQGDNDFKHRPNTRHKDQPLTMKQCSLIAGSLERLSFTLLQKKDDSKQDEDFLRQIISTMNDVTPDDVYEEVMARIDEEMFADPPAVEAYEAGSSDSSESEAEVDHSARLQIIKSKLKELLGLE